VVHNSVKQTIMCTIQTHLDTLYMQQSQQQFISQLSVILNMFCQCIMNWKVCEMKRRWLNLKLHPHSCFEVPRKATKPHRQDSRCSSKLEPKFSETQTMNVSARASLLSGSLVICTHTYILYSTKKLTQQHLHIKREESER